MKLQLSLIWEQPSLQQLMHTDFTAEVMKIYLLYLLPAMPDLAFRAWEKTNLCVGNQWYRLKSIFSHEVSARISWNIQRREWNRF